MFNVVVISGRLTAEPELKHTNSGASVCSFTIANETGYGDKKKTHFIPVVAWNKTAELLSRFCHKGSMVGIEGQIHMRKYEDKEGKSHNVFEVLASNIQFMEAKRIESGSPKASTDQEYEEADEYELPF